MQRRIFFGDTLTHCYQRTADGGILFYSFSDHLVHFTIYCSLARKYGIQVLSLCHMPDHIHDSIRATQRDKLEHFKRETSCTFSRQWNKNCHLRGSVMEGPFGSAPKTTDKKARANLIYVGNNPVERKLTAKAEEYRWNFLAYALSDHPFSEKLVIRNARWPLQKAVKEIKILRKEDKPLNYATLNRLFKPLERSERLQLADFIISTYNAIDYAAAIRYFGSFDKMISSMHLTTGSEYDIKEQFTGKTDVHYNTISSILMQQYGIKDVHSVLYKTNEEKHELFFSIARLTSIPPEYIAKYLHVQLVKR